MPCSPDELIAAHAEALRPLADTMPTPTEIAARIRHHAQAARAAHRAGNTESRATRIARVWDWCEYADMAWREEDNDARRAAWAKVRRNGYATLNRLP